MLNDPIMLAVIAIFAIAAAALVAGKNHVLGPLLLIVIGVIAGFTPAAGDVQISGDLVLLLLLPPLLYSASTGVPTMRFRRDLGPIAALSILLVVVSSIAVGLVFWAIIPGITLGWAIALGAIVSPTDAVATSIVKSVGVSPRTVAILEGEGLLNDATALVMLRAAIVATAVSVTSWSVAWQILFAVAVAAVIGVVVGRAALWARARISLPSVSTALSFTVPFLAAIPSEHLGASGLVAAVVAGLVTGHRAPAVLSSQQRHTDQANWATVELVIEGAIFLGMGLYVHTLVHDLGAIDANAAVIVVAVAAGLLTTIAIRAIVVVPLVAALRRSSSRAHRKREQFTALRDAHLDPNIDPAQRAALQARREEFVDRFAAQHSADRRTRRRVERLRDQVLRRVADLQYFAKSPLTMRDATVIVWAGMRGAITVAAAQTLPEDTPQRPLLLAVAFAIAALSLLVQGTTLRPLVTALHPTPAPDPSSQDAERDRLVAYITAKADHRDHRRGAGEPVEGHRPALSAAPEPAGTEPDAGSARLAWLQDARAALLQARESGMFDSDILSEQLELIDSEELLLHARARAAGHDHAA